MKKALHILLMLALFASAASVSTAQIKQSGKVTKPTKTETPKCKTCGKTIDKCQYKGKHPAKCKTCGKTIDKCQYGGKHPTGSPQAEKNRILKELQNSMVWVDGGTFTMGAVLEPDEPHPGYYLDEVRIHQVTLSGFYICKFEVTQELWLAVMGNNPSHDKGNLRMPVNGVSWNECQEFISKLNKMTGKHYRMPTEAEWEFAARGGNLSKGYLYSGSNNLDDVAWYEVPDFTPRVVGQKKPNELGLYDMSGNIREWCQDWHIYYTKDAQNNPTGPTSGTERICRGGSVNYGEGYFRVYTRYHDEPSDNHFFHGLRLAASSL